MVKIYELSGGIVRFDFGKTFKDVVKGTFTITYAGNQATVITQKERFTFDLTSANLNTENYDKSNLLNYWSNPNSIKYEQYIRDKEKGSLVWTGSGWSFDSIGVIIKVDCGGNGITYPEVVIDCGEHVVSKQTFLFNCV